MDSWEPKMPSWDLGTVVAPSGGGGGGGGALDLKLGAPTSWRPVPTAAVASVQQQQQQPPPPSAAPAKRARAGQGQQTVPPCSVEGCTADLSRCREYHRRHKVCEAHSKTPVVAVAGQQQRFCQQCSRFHLLGEFDEVKRSCRKRLDGHNRRRRKPQSDPLNPVGLFANHHGVTRFASYPQIFSPTSMAEPKWPGGIAVKTEADAFHEQYYSFSGAASLFQHGKPERKHFPFLTDGGGEATFGCQPPAFTITPSSESSSNSSRHSNGKTTMFAHDGGPDHNCALSLLSDNPAPAHIMVPAEAHHLGGGGGGVTIQYGGGGKVARLHNNGDVSLTGLSYVSLGDKGSPMLHTSNRSQHNAATATTAVTSSTAPAPAPAAASQLQQYHGYYHHQHQHQVSADQGNHQDAGGMHALPFSSW